MKELSLQGFDNLANSFAQGALEDGLVIGPHADVYAYLIGAVNTKHALLAASASEAPKAPKPKRKLLKGK